MPLSRSVKTKFMGGGNIPITIDAAETQFLGIIDDWAPQDKIRIIGCLVNMEMDVKAPNFALACECKGMVELTRAGRIERDGSICRAEMQTIWATTVVNTGFDSRKQIVVMFPEGYGIDVDSAEMLNLCAYFYKSTNQDFVFFGSATIYYVER